MAESMAGKDRSEYRVYSPEERQAAVADVAVMGLGAAARKHGAPKSTLSRWSRAQATSEVIEGNAGGSLLSDGAVESEITSAFEKSGTSVPRVARVYAPSEKARVVEYAQAEGVGAAQKKFGVSRWTIYDWLRRVKRAAVGQGPSPTSGEDPKAIELRRDQEILGEWHRHPGLGPSQIKNQLRRSGVKVSVHTARRVMEDAGYRPPKVERRHHDERYEAVRPNHMWHLDFVQRFINRASTFTLILIDDCTRFVVGHAVAESEQADVVVKCFEEAVRLHGRPEAVLHDKGSAFWSWRGISRFTAFLTELGIDQVVAKHKEWNGKAEVFNANLHKEFFDVTRFFDVAEMRRRLSAHLSWYNHQRTHHALGGLLVPADRYYGRADEVLARLEAGVGREAADGLGLRERCLELFKVVSHEGQAEVWLLGKKLLGLPA